MIFLAIVFMVTRPSLPTKPAPHSPEYLAHLNSLRERTEKEVGQSIQSRSFLVIGGTGFTGGVLVDDLIARKAKSVRVLSRRLPKGDAQKKGVEFLAGSMTDVATLKKAMENVDVVFHTAAAYGTPPNGRFGPYENSAPKKVNVGGMAAILEACKSSPSVNLLVFTSSMHTTFDPDKDQIGVKESAPYHWNAVDHYSRSKIEAEKLCLDADSNAPNGLRTIALRPSGIYGPQENFFIPKILDIFYKYGKIAPTYFDKKERFEFTFVYNIAWAHALATAHLDRSETKAFGNAFFVTDQTIVNSAALEFARPMIEALGITLVPLIWIPPSILTSCSYWTEWLCYNFNKYLGLNVQPIMTESEAKTLLRSQTVDPSFARDVLGYSPLIDTGEGTAWTAEEFSRRYNRVAKNGIAAEL